MENIVNFQPAVRKGSHVIIVYYGESGCGKTLSAIKTARGLVGPSGRFAVLDTENERALIYAKEAGGWTHGNLTPPFTPERYTQAIQAAEAAGFECLVIDSGSHEWEGIGGILETAEASNLKGLVKWAGPKAVHKRYVQALLQTRMHLIICLRAKEKMVQLKAGDPIPAGKKIGDIVSDGFVSIQDKRFIYEATVQIFLPNPQQRGAKRGVPLIEKCPQDLLPVFDETRQIGIDTGERIREWINGGVPVDQAFEALKRAAEEIASKGTAAIQAYWGKLPKADKVKLQSYLPNLKDIAATADRAAEQTQQSDQQQAPADTLLDDPFGRGGGDAAPSGFALVSADGEIQWAGDSAADFTEHMIQAVAKAPDALALAALFNQNGDDLARIDKDQRTRINKADEARRALFGNAKTASAA